jgi:hypothetical protein
MKGHCMLTKGQQDISDKVISLMESSGFRSTYFREPDLFEL